MKKKIKNINGWNIIWLLIYLMPFLLSLGYTFIFAYGVKGNVSTFTDLDYTLATYYLKSFTNLFGSTSGFIASTIRQILTYFGMVSSNELYNKIFPLVIQYIVVVAIIRVAVDVLLMLPNIIHNFIDKIGGERE